MMTALVLVGLLCPQDTGEQYWKFTVGSVWEYEESDGTNKKKSVLTVREHKDGKTYIKSEEFAEGEKEPQVKTVATYAKDGFVFWAEEEDGQLRERIKLYKIGSKKGDTWSSAVDDGMEMTIKNLGTEEVKVGAGTYKDAIHLQFEMGSEEMGGKFVGDYWIAPNVGLIKMDFKMGEMGSMTMELKKFTKK
jgi:hypothetical protein